MKRGIRIIAGVGALVVGVALTAWGHGGVFVDENGDGIHDRVRAAHAMKGRGLGTLLEQKGLALTSDQQTQIDQLKTDHQNTAAPLKSDLQTKHTELRDLMKAATPDQASINAKIDEINAIRSELQKEATAFRNAVRGVLTADQQAALDAARAEVKTGRGHRGHRGRK